MKITAIILSIMLIAISLSGCRTVREIYSGSHWDNNSLFLLERNKSTAKDIAYSFGSPQKEIIGGEKGRIWVYYYEKSKGEFQQAQKLCANCYEKTIKSTLQERKIKVGRDVGLVCANGCPELIFDCYKRE